MDKQENGSAASTRAAKEDKGSRGWIVGTAADAGARVAVPGWVSGLHSFRAFLEGLMPSSRPERGG